MIGRPLVMGGAMAGGGGSTGRGGTTGAESGTSGAGPTWAGTGTTGTGSRARYVRPALEQAMRQMGGLLRLPEQASRQW